MRFSNFFWMLTSRFGLKKSKVGANLLDCWTYSLEFHVNVFVLLLFSLSLIACKWRTLDIYALKMYLKGFPKSMGRFLSSKWSNANPWGNSREYVFIKCFLVFNHLQRGSLKKPSIVFLIVDRRYNWCTKQLWLMGWWWWLWKMDWIHSLCWSHCWWRRKIWWTRRSLLESLQCMSTFWSIKFS